MENEIWKDINGYEESYQISSLGNVRSKDRTVSNHTGVVLLKSQLLAGHINRGYPRVTLCRNNESKVMAIHRLVAINFIPNPGNKAEVNHIDGNKTNNSLSNLEWSTRKENMNHADRTGLRDVRGEKSYSAKLNELQVRIIRRLKGEFTERQLGQMFKVGHAAIGSIHRGTKWKSLFEENVTWAKANGYSEDRLTKRI